ECAMVRGFSAAICGGAVLRWLAAVLAVGSLPIQGDGTRSATGKADSAKEEFFETRVRPLLADNCLECHRAGKHKGGLRLDGRYAMIKGGDTGRVIVPGKPEESPLIEAIRYQGEVKMPPKKKLKDEEIAALTEWVKQGATWAEPRPVATTRPGATTTAGATQP